MGNVTMTKFRRNGGPEVKIGTRVGSSESIAAHLAEYELGFGGQVEDISSTEVVIATQVMNCYDTTRVVGTEDDMRIIIEMCAYHSVAVGENREAIISAAVGQMQQLGIRLTPLNLTMYAPMFMGGNSIKAAMLVAFGLTEPAQIEAVLERNLSFKDLAAAFELVHRDGCAIEDALAAAA